MNFTIADPAKNDSRFSRAFAAKFLICDYLRKSAAELVLLIANC